MSDNDSTDDATVESTLDSTTLAVASTYKILGEFTDDSGAGVLGKNNASSGTPIGVQGAVPNSSGGYGLATPDDVSVGGSLELDGNLQSSADLDLTVSGGTRALRLEEPGTDSGGATAGANVVTGHPNNSVDNDAVGSVIAGGGASANFENLVLDNYGTVGGGLSNWAGDSPGADDFDPSTNPYATVGGGAYNIANGEGATVAGGVYNETRGDYAAVPGGHECVANTYCFAAGRRAKAQTYEGVFIWADSTDADFTASSAPNNSGVVDNDTFKVRAGGGVLFVTSGGSTYIPSDSTGWSNSSSRAMKTNIDPVDPETALEKVDSLEVATWEYEDDGEGTGVRHIGPMAEEFHEAFEVGDSDEHINSVNADGAAFAAIQGLSEKLDERAARIEELEAESEAKDERIDDLEADIAEKDERIDDLEQRLAALESQVEPATPADD